MQTLPRQTLPRDLLQNELQWRLQEIIRALDTVVLHYNYTYSLSWRIVIVLLNFHGGAAK